MIMFMIIGFLLSGQVENAAWFKKGSGTVVRSTLRAVPATVPDPFLNHAENAPIPTYPNRRHKMKKKEVQPCVWPISIVSAASAAT
jgi:hypothetical protein